MTLTDCKKIISKKDISDSHFLKLHFCVEDIYRRLFFIGLRKRGVYYKTAKKISESYYNPNHKEYYDTIFSYCEINKSGLLTNKKFKTLLDLYMNFTSFHRNKRVHGIANAYKDKEFLKLLIKVDKDLIKEILTFLKLSYKLDIFDKPKNWNIKRGNKEDTDNIYNELYSKGLLKKKIYTKEQVAQKLKGLK